MEVGSIFMADPWIAASVHQRGGCKAHGAALSELYVCTGPQRAESDELQKMGPEMQKTALGGSTACAAESGKMFFF
jgi:hypothetical protein